MTRNGQRAVSVCPAAISYGLATIWRWISGIRWPGETGRVTVATLSIFAPACGQQSEHNGQQFEHAGVANNAGMRQDSRSEYQGLKLSASRPFWSWQGIKVDSVFSHSAGTKRSFKESEWVSDSSHSLSSFGLRCAGKQELPGGFVAGTGLTALGGTEHHESVSQTAHSTEKAAFTNWRCLPHCTARFIGGTWR